MNVTRKQIKNLFINFIVTIQNGLWFSGETGEGDYKQW